MNKKITALVIISVSLGMTFASAAPAKKPAKQPSPVKKQGLQAYQATIGPSLAAKLAGLTNTGTVGAIVTFNTSTGLAGIADLDTPVTGLLARHGIIGITANHRLQTLGMIAAVLTKSQINALATEREVRSIWADDQLFYNLHQARVLCGVDKLRADAALTAQNGGRVIDGSLASGQFSVALIDSGIDTTNTDLPFDITTSLNGTVPSTGKVIQNVQVVGDDALETVTYLENQANTDSVGHGSHCAGIIGGTGGFSRTNMAQTYPSAGQTDDFSGVAGRFTGSSATDLATNPLGTASGVKIVGLGSGAGLFVLDALGGFEYAVDNQVKYNIKITSNSYGSIGVYSPDDPLNVAIKSAYDHGIVTVFAAGNSGPGVDTISSNSKSPYVICVAAGTKEGGLASFSSRGISKAERDSTPLQTDAEGNQYNPNAFNLIAITAPGTGREFEFDSPFDPTDNTVPNNAATTTPNPDTNGKKFYSDIISTRSKSGTAASGTNDQEFPAPYQINYTMISGTSMATPFVAGTCALLFSVNPSLTPDQVKAIIQQAATYMPGFQDYETGVGYLNDYAAVDYTLNPAKPYGPFHTVSFNAVVNSTQLPPSARPLEDDGSTKYPPANPDPPATGPNVGEDFTMPYTPVPSATPAVPSTSYSDAKEKATGYPNNNAYAFSVAPDQATGKLPSVLDVRIQFGQDSAGGVVGGNSLGLYLWAPDGTFYSSGLALPILDDPSREVVVNNPIPGTWIAELRPVRGLAAVPITPPTGVGLPDTTTGQIYRTNLTAQDPPDITELPQANAVRFALANRYMDVFPSGLFEPSAAVTRDVFAQALADNAPLRQSLASSGSAFSDVSGNLARVAEALSIPGSTLRDWDFTPAPTLGSGPTTFAPSSPLSRSQVAVSLVRALGLDKEAQVISGKTVQVNYNGVMTDVVDANDSSQLDPSAKGYVQMALNRGILTYFVTQPPGGGVTIHCYPSNPIIRADLAVALDAFRQVFSQGNSLSANELP